MGEGADGSVYFNKKSIQIFISVTQKDRYVLDLFSKIYGGRVYASDANKTAFKWVVYRKEEVLGLVDKYFKLNPCVSAKNDLLCLVKEFYYLASMGAFKSTKDPFLIKSVIQFEEKWCKISKPFK